MQVPAKAGCKPPTQVGIVTTGSHCSTLLNLEPVLLLHVLLNVEILSGVVSKDHVHMLVSMPPQISVSKLVQKLKGKTSYKMQREFQALRKQYWGQRMWSRGYFACSTGNVSDEMIRSYVQIRTDLPSQIPQPFSHPSHQH